LEDVLHTVWEQEAGWRREDLIDLAIRYSKER
jgi:hypothetical protein